MTQPAAQNYDREIVSEEKSMELLFHKLDEAIDDMEQGRVQLIEDAWKEIDAIQGIYLGKQNIATRYRVVLADSAKEDNKERKRYIRDTFLSRDLAENFSSKIKTAIQKLEIFPSAYKPTGFTYRGYEIYLKPQLFYVLCRME